MRTSRMIVMGLTGLFLSACTINLFSANSLLPIGSSFVVSGTAVLLDNGGPCPAWVGDNGVTYHLFQTPSLPNEVFDHVRTPGVSSRLELQTRSDITLDCRVGTVVQVRSVLEVVE